MSRERFQSAELPGGLKVLTEEMPGIRSASVGVWVRFGSAHERPEEMGASHLLEHMAFKGTPRRSAREIAHVLERVGGSLDAYTTREHTAFQARVLDEHVDLAFDVLSDIVLHPELRQRDLELEREVVLEEISTVEDTPDDLVFELHAEALWRGHPYGYSILGTRETVSQFEVEELAAIHARGYRRPTLIVAAAGGIRHAEVVERVEALFADAHNGSRPTEVPAVPTVEPNTLHVPRQSAQTHLVLGTSTFGHADPRRYAMVLLSSAFGGGMSSRLFQRVREELGLAYSVFAYHSFYAHGGMCGVYVGTRPEWADQAEEVIRNELRRLAHEGLTSDELSDIKNQVSGQLALSLESSSARLQRLASFALYDEPFIGLDELVGRVNAVSAQEVAEVAQEYFDPDRQVIVRLGPEGE